MSARFSSKRFFQLLLLIFLGSPLAGQTCGCSPEDLARDSIQLRKFYDAMGGEAWDIGSNWPELSLSSWEGIYISDEDNSCILCLDLDGLVQGQAESGCEVWAGFDSGGNNLVSQNGWPIDFQLPCLEKLSLVQNNLNIEIPNFSGFNSLRELFLQSTGLYGEIRTDKFQNPEMTLLNLNSNDLRGDIPQNLLSIEGLQSLKQLFINNNLLDDVIPNMTNGALEFLDVTDNQLTFEDLRPNFAINSTLDLFFYSTQDSIFRRIDTTVSLALPFSIDLDIDHLEANNVYRWTKDGSVLPNQTGRILEIDSFTVTDTGTYLATVTNFEVPNLTLTSFPINIDACTPGIRDIAATLCPGEELALAPDLSFSGDSLYYLPSTQAANNCDSVWRVDLSFFSPGTSQLGLVACVGAQADFNGMSYGPGNYNVVLSAAGRCGLDSTVQLTVTEATADNFGMAEINNVDLSCGPDYQPMGNQPPGTLGQWVLPPGAAASNLNDPQATIAGLTPYDVSTLGWSLSAGGCPPYDTVFGEVYYEPPMIATNDTLRLFDNQANPLTEPPFPILPNDDGHQDFPFPGELNFSIVEQPEQGSAEINNDSMLVYTRVYGTGQYTLRYVLGGNRCPADTAVVIIDVAKSLLEAKRRPPNVITPNGDGYNDVLVIPELINNGVPGSRLTVYQGKKMIIQIENYANDWGGWDGDNFPLRAGEGYRYVVEYGDRRESEASGLSIIRNRP